ncbi:hypothetical protein GY45DRAFT_1430587 [Cubamyces sp. BRFM 1775]|nr:hypothetical protein GY45DRAFT_1430587 [Cubamyces sp. BRFM 1775]
MERRGRGQPQQRHSSLPASLHRLMVSGPSEPSESPNREAAQELLLRGRDAGGAIPFGDGPGPVPPAPDTEQQLPSFSLPRDVFHGVRDVEPSGSRRQSVSPILHRAGEPSSVGAVPALPLPPFQPQRILRTDPAFYASTSSLSPARSVPAPGPQLRPISWSPESVAGSPPAAARLGSPDRSALAPAPRAPPQSISFTVSPPSPPVAGPSRLPVPEEPQTSGRKRKARTKKTQGELLPEAAPASATSSATRRRRDASDSERDVGRSASATSATGFLAGGNEVSVRTARPAASARRAPEAGPSSRRPSESGRGSPASSTADNYPVVVGSTAYSVTTLSPLRATILPPAVEPVPAPEAAASQSVPSGGAAGPSSRETVEETTGEGSRERTGGPFDAVDEAVAVEAARGPSGKRRRRARSEPQAESTTSSSSEHATQAPKSKKTLIACHFCRDPRSPLFCIQFPLGATGADVVAFSLPVSFGTIARKLRCDGQKPSCANCRKRNHPCTYEQQPKRRGPGKTPRGSSRKRTKQQQHQQPDSAVGGSADAARTAEVASGSASTGTATASAPAPEAAGPSNAEAAPATSAQATTSTSTSTSPRAGSVSASASASTSAPPSAPASASTSATAQAGPSSIPQQTFEPILTGPVPTYPGFAYRPPSAASSYSGGQLPPFHFHGLSVGRGMSRSVASDSVRSSNASNVSSAPSVPDSEEGGEGSVAAMDYAELEEYIDYPELDDFYRQPPPGPGRGEEGSQ